MARLGLSLIRRQETGEAPAARARRRREASRSDAAERERAGVGPREQVKKDNRIVHFTSTRFVNAPAVSGSLSIVTSAPAS
jgi:hypothetical protein